MPANIPPHSGDTHGQTRVPMVLGFSCTLLPLAVIMGAMRFYVRYYMLHSIGLDDWLFFSSVIAFVAHNIAGIWAVTKGLGVRDFDLHKEGLNPAEALTLVCRMHIYST